MSSTASDYVRVPLTACLDEQGLDLKGEISEQITYECSQNDNKSSFLSLEYYQRYFDVDTSQVLRRLASSLLPNPRVNFMQQSLKPRADLYGPFWIATTLMLAAAIGGNVSDYLQSRGKMTSWHYDFQKVTLASTVIYMYWWIVPTALYTLFYMLRNAHVKSQRTADGDLTDSLSSSDNIALVNRHHTHKLFDLLSVYGYSLTVFVPVAIAFGCLTTFLLHLFAFMQFWLPFPVLFLTFCKLLWTIQSVILQWILFILAMVVSSAFLVFALSSSFKKEHSKLATPLIICVIMINCAFSFTLMVTFFYGSPASQLNISPPIAPILEPLKDLSEQNVIGDKNKAQEIQKSISQVPPKNILKPNEKR